MSIIHPNGNFDVNKLIYVGVATNSCAAIQEGIITWSKALDIDPSEIIYLVEENSLGKALLDSFPKRPQYIAWREPPEDVVGAVEAAVSTIPDKVKIVVVAHLHGAFTTDVDLRTLRHLAQRRNLLLVVPAMLREDVSLDNAGIETLGEYVKANLPYKYCRDVMAADVGIVMANVNGWVSAVAKHRGVLKIPDSQRVTQLS